MNKETIFSLLLAAVVVLGGISLMSKSIKPIPENVNNQSIKKDSGTPNQLQTYAPIEQLPEITPRTSSINKCFLAGKVIYSDVECASNSRKTTVKIEDSEGIDSPDRETVTATMKRMIAENKRNREASTNQVASLEIPKNIDPLCTNYKNQMQYLEAQAKQPNSVDAANRIRKEKFDVQKLQLEGNCYGR